MSSPVRVPTRWRKIRGDTGPSYELRRASKVLMRVSPYTEGWSREQRGWYFYGSGFNSVDPARNRGKREIFATEEDAKVAAIERLRELVAEGKELGDDR